jgi:16S rRNA (adenine1518-N6/adenine1519-N6)-dimethyltransferase
MKKRPPFGQNFLADPDIARHIADCAHVTAKDVVVEIGPGHGEMTQYLIEQAQQLIAVELDPKLCSRLQQRFGANERFSLAETDALRYDYSQIGPRFKVVSNLPYYAATHILKRLIQYRTRITDMTVMIQKEVADRICADPGTRDYGSLTVFIRFYCAVERLLEVKKHSFNPPPKIDSTVIRITPLPRPSVRVDDEDAFFRVVHAAFIHKRKTLKNNLTQWHKLFAIDQNKIEMAGIDLSRRGETLTLEEFARISNTVHTQHG